MFIGHYGPAAAFGGGRIKLWHAFVAVQLLDILWAPFVLLGVEHLRIVENFTAANHLDLYHMPFSHSLLMALFWSSLAGGLYGAVRKEAGAPGVMIIAMLVFSHWVLDFVTHKPDLELWFGGPEVGLGLWDHRLVAFGLEFGLLIGGLIIYLRDTKPKGTAGAAAPIVIAALLFAAQLYANMAPPPASPQAAAMSALLAYGVFALLAAWADATRIPRKPFPKATASGP